MCTPIYNHVIEPLNREKDTPVEGYEATLNEFCNWAGINQPVFDTNKFIPEMIRCSINVEGSGIKMEHSAASSMAKLNQLLSTDEPSAEKEEKTDENGEEKENTEENNDEAPEDKPEDPVANLQNWAIQNLPIDKNRIVQPPKYLDIKYVENTVTQTRHYTVQCDFYGFKVTGTGPSKELARVVAAQTISGYQKNLFQKFFRKFSFFRFLFLCYPL